MIKTVRVKNFKSLHDVTVTLGRRNVFVGPNMSGKSNIIDVFKFLTNMIVSEPGTAGVANAFNRRGGFLEVAWKGEEPKPITISLEGEYSKSRLQHGGDDEVVGDVRSWKYEISFVSNPHGFVHVQRENLEIDNGIDKVKIIEMAEGKRVLRNMDSRHVSDVSDRDRAALEFEIPDWDGNELRTMIQTWRFYHLVPALMRGVNQTAAANVLKEYGDNLSAWLMTLQTRYRESFDRLLASLKDVFPDVTNVFAWTTEQATVFATSQERFLKRATPVWQMSDGELAFIALLSLIWAPQELGSPLYGVEEPENYLHPRLMETLVTLLNQRQQELGARSAQVLLTTHSSHVIDQFGIDDLIVVEKRRGSTMCTRPSAKKHLRELLSREEAGLGELYFSGSLSGA